MFVFWTLLGFCCGVKRSLRVVFASTLLVKMSYLGVGSSPGNVPVFHGSNLRMVDRRVRLAELVLRCLICGLGVLAAVLVGTDTQVKEIFTIQKKAKFTDMKALVFLVIANGLAAAYSLVQVLRCVVSMVRGSVLFNKPLAWAIFSGDQLMAYLTLAAVAVAAQSSVIAKFGEPELQWMKVCDLYGKFCNQVGEGIASAMAVSLSMVVLSGISAFSLFRLYGGNNGKSSTRR
ncbi:CASP-like protein 2B1 [Cornus florida]|uniref:CASP-like protein 2B1 n=1 Tax=Cornus florida TaxID=4283 RepID=UPI0028A29580|nr:CASP-like protein 2B1 [Cornus florida]